MEIPPRRLWKITQVFICRNVFGAEGVVNDVRERRVNLDRI